jgi:hypothetical protein
MVTSVLAAMAMVVLLLIVLVGLNLLSGFGTRFAGYALVSPAQEPPVSPPPMAESDTDDEECAKWRRVQLQPLLDGRRFWNNEVDASILGAAGRATYGAAVTYVWLLGFTSPTSNSTTQRRWTVCSALWMGHFLVRVFLPRPGVASSIAHSPACCVCCGEGMLSTGGARKVQTARAVTSVALL